jgi:hypothetical protein
MKYAVKLIRVETICRIDLLEVQRVFILKSADTCRSNSAGRLTETERNP